MAAPLVFQGAELVDRAGELELVFVDPADGAEYRVGVRTVRPPVVPPPPAPSNFRDADGRFPGDAGPELGRERYGPERP